MYQSIRFSIDKSKSGCIQFQVQSNYSFKGNRADYIHLTEKEKLVETEENRNPLVQLIASIKF